MNEIGATGKYPKGKLDDSDEGELAMKISADKPTGTVKLEFGKPVAWVAMDAAEAEGLADLLILKANELK